MRLLLTGATGAAGLNIYRAALTDPTVSRITLVMRREMPSWAALPSNAADKTDTIIHSDFASYPPELASRLAQHDACIWALGITSVGMNEADYTRITYDYPMAMARALKDGGAGKDRPTDKPFRFVYVSGEGADPSPTAKQMWARVKGRAETDVLAFCNETPGMRAHVMRPGMFLPSFEHPEDRKHQRKAWENVVGAVLWPIVKIGMPSMLTPTAELSGVALALAKGQFPDQDMFRNTEMRKMAKELGVA